VPLSGPALVLALSRSARPQALEPLRVLRVLGVLRVLLQGLLRWHPPRRP